MPVVDSQVVALRATGKEVAKSVSQMLLVLQGVDAEGFCSRMSGCGVLVIIGVTEAGTV